MLPLRRVETQRQNSLRLPECEITAATELDRYRQMRGKCSARMRIRQFYMTGTTTRKQNTITDELALARFFDPRSSSRTITRPRKSEPSQLTLVTELSITSWNPVTLNHCKLERFLTNSDADLSNFKAQD